jgi:probable F420-dependent oxidoreductase
VFPGKLAVWAGVDAFPSAESAAFAQRVEAWGYDALWIPEGPGREVVASSGWLLANTKKLVVASGIANIYARDAMASVGAQHTLNEQSGGRFVLGLGVSHVPLVKGMRHHDYGAPVPTMRAYLEAMASAPYMGPRGPGKALTILAALGPKMLALSAELADGAHPYNVTPEHTAQAREILGKGKLLLVEQKCILESDAAKARATGRQALAIYLGLPNYVNTWKRLGFTDADVAGGGSDRLIDAMFAWGDEKAIRARIEAHWQAGADQVCVQAIGQMQGKLALPDEKLLALLAPG